MLRVTKIIEGGIDLTSGEQIEQGMVISNGYREVTVPVPETVLADVVRLYVEAVEANVAAAAPQQTSITPEPKPAPRPPVKLRPVDSEPASPPPDFEYDSPPPSSDTDDDTGFEPGEDYDDSGTGVSSL